MKTVSPSNEAIGQIMRWLEGNAEWSAVFSAVVNRQRDSAVQRAFAGDEGAFDAFMQPVGSQVFGWAFETFLSGRVAGHVPDNPIDDFLKRRGWRLNPLGQRYLRAMQDSAPTLFEVLDVSPGHHVDVRDLILPGEPFRVCERAGSRQMQRWDLLCARVVEMPEGRVFTGAPLPVTGRESKPFVAAAQQAIQGLIDEAACAGTTPEHFRELARRALRGSADEFFVLWAAQSVTAAAPPHITNSDGDAIVFHTRRYTLRPRARERLMAAFAVNGDLHLDSVRPRRWSWVQPPQEQASRQADRGLALDSRDINDPTRVNAASLELKSNVLTAGTNSAARMAWLEKWLLPLLAADVISVTTEAKTLDEAQEAAPRKSEPIRRPVPRHLAERLEREFLENHYRAWVDMQLPALDGATPRDAAADPQRRGAVVELLREMENKSAHGVAQGEPPFDFTSVWQALGLAHLRR